MQPILANDMTDGAPQIKRSDLFRILLADDHTLMRQILRAILGTYPNLSIVGEAVDGMEAVSMAAALKPDGIIIDVNMPKMNGIQARNRLKQHSPKSGSLDSQLLMTNTSRKR